MYTWQAGEEVTAEKLNSMTAGLPERMAQVEHNTLELFLENYFSGKQTPYQGLFFDGFGDFTKSDMSRSTTSSTSKAKVFVLGAGGGIAGGGGGYQYSPTYAMSGGATSVTVGQGAVGVAGGSSIFGSLTATGGDSAVAGTSGLLNGRPQGNTSGSGKDGGGGGATGNGNDGGPYSSSSAGNGGAGFSCDISGATVTYGGGGGGSNGDPYSYGGGGVDGGGNGRTASGGGTHIPATNGVDGRGGGCGRGGGARGGHGVVMVAYKTDGSDGILNTSTGGTKTTSGAYTIHTFTTSGTFTANVAGISNPVEVVSSAGFSVGDAVTLYDGTYQESTTISAIPDGTHLSFNPTVQSPFTGVFTVKRSTATIDTGNKQVVPTASIGNGKLFTYHSKKQSFTQAMQSAKLWIMRNATAQYSLNAGISAGATSLVVAGDKRPQFAVGDIVDIWGGTARERRTLTGVTYSTNTTLEWTSGLTNAYTTSNKVERVDVKPKLSIVASGASESFADMDLVKTNIVTVSDSRQVEGQYNEVNNAIIGNASIQKRATVVNINQSGRVLDYIELRNLKKVASPTDGLFISIYSGTTVGSGTLLGTSAVVLASTLTAEPQNIMFSFGGIALTGTWHFRVERTGAVDNTNHYTVGENSTTFNWSHGNGWYYTGASWSDLGGNQVLAFEFQTSGSGTYYEDEYEYTAPTAGNDVVARLEVSRNDTALTPVAKRLGVSLSVV